MALVAYSPFGSGAFPPKVTERRAFLEELAIKHRASPYQIALAWLTRKSHVFAIPKSSNPVRAKENTQSAAIDLSKEERRRIEASFPLGPRPAHLPMI